jgi:FKBP-type peptidyl-prolyl cis-trans isomerase SlyD
MEHSLDSNNKPEKVAKDVVVSLDYTLNVDGEVVDFSDKEEPLEYIQGRGQIIPGLENALVGMGVGQNKKVKVTAQEAYGEIDPSAIVEVSRNDFPPDVPVEIGTPLQVRNMEGEVLDARITQIDGEKVQLDFNHPLAGKDLLFDVTVVNLRSATDEELAHGHVHGDDHDQEFEDDFDDELDDFDEDDDHRP